ncbi:PKD domain-containing protein [Ancylomarina sp. 16SWW S1-10-2]|uniref:PKD domain-containing protein n=1 Tax=Ancylomarina sp. 16SWW S1-10-2 TaxID=2499681 RepID=UPI0012ADADDA|nr:PKD domain-containing protein [Ancylomarina sp. 16SWW S1-10-2]MRT92501.1 PKD domain-containing protein [Ancylomarina sp. 16SWW S1-10-2]
MKNNILNLKLNQSSVWKMLILVLAVSFTACDFEYDLPDADSKADGTPPSALFTYAQGQGSAEEWKDYTFSNLSNSATDYVWDFGDGNTSTEKDGKNTYAGEGSFTVTLTSSDKLGVTSSYSETIEIIEPEEPLAIVPVILEASFEDLSLPDGNGDGRDSWRNDFGGVIQITNDPVQDGSQAAKFPSAGDRVAYQDGIAVTPNTDYILTYYYTMKEGTPGSLTVKVLGGTITDLSEADAAKLGEYVGTDISDSSTYVKVSIPFNTGVNETVAIMVTNEDVECRVDTFEIEVAPEN